MVTWIAQFTFEYLQFNFNDRVRHGDEMLSDTKQIASGGRYDDLLKSLGAKNSTPAGGAAINLKNI